jgi:hypothetical protein
MDLRGRRDLLLGVVVATLASGCAQAAAPTAVPTPAATFAILYAPPNAGCPLAGATDVTFRIDPHAPEAVLAVADDGRASLVMWPPGFVAGTHEERIVKDPAGWVVARDGQRLIAPQEGFPKLPGGWPVCFGGGAIWVQEQPMP